MLMKHKQKCGEDNITAKKTSNESHLYWKKHFLKNPLYFRIYADFKLIMKKIFLLYLIKQQIFTDRSQF